MNMNINLTQYQIDQLNFFRRSTRFKGTPLSDFICLVIDDWLSGGIYLSDK